MSKIDRFFIYGKFNSEEAVLAIHPHSSGRGILAFSRKPACFFCNFSGTARDFYY
jgi:hypothetical protein